MTGALDFDPDRFVDQAPPAVLPLREMPPEWQHGLQLLADRNLPRGASADRWAQVIADAHQVATRYKDWALDAGWNIANLFGYDPDQPHGFVGLAVRMRGRRLIDIKPDEAIIRGANQVVFHRPLMPADAPLLWNFRDNGGRR
jgi:hypothetical protein